MRSNRLPWVSGVRAMALVVGAAGCGGTAASQAPSSSTVQPRRSPAPPRVATRTRRRAPHRGSAERAGGLIVAQASNEVVQSQPPPGSCHARGAGLFSEPDPRCTPGAINPAVTQGDIDQTICVSGWTETVRPPESITEQEKAASMAAYGDGGSMGGYEYDHLVSLELGGATNDPRNLWPEPGASPNPKDSVEAALHDRVCGGQMPLAVAQRIIASDWVGWAQSNGITSSSSGGSGGATSTSSTPSGASGASSATVVHPGSYCSPAGARGVTDAGTAMVCRSSSSDPRDRWRRA